MKKVILLLVLLVLIIGCAEDPIACTEDAKLCPDGSAVGRVPPDCQFAECPKVTNEINHPEGNEDIFVENNPELEQEIVEQDPNLIAHWEFEDTGDDSANDYHGEIKGDATFITGKVGKALSFDGVDDYVDFSKSIVDKMAVMSKGTVTFWFKFESMLDKQTLMPIFYIGVEESEPDYMFIIEIGHFKDAFSGEGFPRSGYTGPTMNPDPTNKKLYVTWVKDNKDPFLCYDSNLNLEENKWYHFAVVVGPDGNTGYLNGVEMSNRHYNFGSASNPYFLDDIQNKKKLMIGHGRSVHTFSPDFVYFKGALDDFRIYDRALSAEEINTIKEG